LKDLVGVPPVAAWDHRPVARYVVLAGMILGICAGCGEAAGTAEQQSGCPFDLSSATGGAGGEVGDEAGVYSPTWSPDGERIAFSTTSELYVLSVVNCAVRQVRPARGDTLVDSIDWSPDGSSFAFISGPGAGEGLWTMSADGSRPRALAKGAILFPAWSPDGRRIAFIDDRVDEVAATEDRNVWVVNADGPAGGG
jgi:dipeptidyl aminopeptidase/acylaminoacyl peptidase